MNLVVRFTLQSKLNATVLTIVMKPSLSDCILPSKSQNSIFNYSRQKYSEGHKKCLHDKTKGTSFSFNKNYRQFEGRKKQQLTFLKITNSSIDIILSTLRHKNLL